METGFHYKPLPRNTHIGAELSIELFYTVGITVKYSHIFVSLSHLPETDLSAAQP